MPSFSSTRSSSSWVNGWTVSSPRKIVHNIVHASKKLEVASQLVTGKTFFLPRRVPVSAKEVNLLSPRTAS